MTPLTLSNADTVRPSLASPAAGTRPAGDWDLLFEAVVNRLRRSAAAAPALLGDVVLDCAQALEQLHRALGPEHAGADRAGPERAGPERAGSERSRQGLQGTHTALAALCPDLGGTQGGERRARHLADHDSLSALPNRSGFSARLDDALSTGGHGLPAFAVLFLDLDDFKPINDRHGNATGNELLRIVAHRLMRSVRAGDMVCRIGGDEFACLLAAPMGREQLGQVACKLFDAVSAPLKIGALELSVRPSIGIAVCPTDGDTALALIERADSAMVRAKRQRMGYAFFDRQADC